jgi:hypothetical protein
MKKILRIIGAVLIIAMEIGFIILIALMSIGAQ